MISYATKQLITNIDSNDRKGIDFDREARRLGAINCLDVEKWRNFYNRTKHMQRSNKICYVVESVCKNYYCPS